MALIDVADVVQAVATLMDDPSQSEIDHDYVIPFINLRWSNLIVNLAMLGLQYGEAYAVLNVPSNTSDLSSYMQSGQPLASLMQPKELHWKPVGAPDSEYVPVASVNELDEPVEGQVGIPEYSWQGGTVLISPPASPVVLRVRFVSMATTLVDPVDNMIRGVGDIIAYRVAELIFAIRGNPLKADMRSYGDTALDDFLAMSAMRSQSTFYLIQPTHRRGPVSLGVVCTSTDPAL